MTFSHSTLIFLPTILYVNVRKIVCFLSKEVGYLLMVYFMSIPRSTKNRQKEKNMYIATLQNYRDSFSNNVNKKYE
jgi:hypothetical protein